MPRVGSHAAAGRDARCGVVAGSQARFWGESGLVSTRKGQGRGFLLPGGELRRSCVLGRPESVLCQQAGTAPRSAPLPKPVLPALPRPAELAGGEGNTALAARQDPLPFRRAAAALRGGRRNRWLSPPGCARAGAPLLCLPARLASHQGTPYQPVNLIPPPWHSAGIPAWLLCFWLLQPWLPHAGGALPRGPCLCRLPCRAVPACAGLGWAVCRPLLWRLMPMGD